MEKSFDLGATKLLLQNSHFYYIICTDNAGSYSYINEKYASQFRHISSDLIGQPYHITMHPDDRRICEEVGNKCYEQPGKLFPAIIRKHDGRGGYIVTQWEFTLLHEDNNPKGVFCLGYDITEVIRSTSLITEMNMDLESMNRMMEAIAFEQSHIVRAPLANIMGLVSVLKGLDLGSNASSVLNMLEESSIKLDNVIRGIVNKTGQIERSIQQ